MGFIGKIPKKAWWIFLVLAGLNTFFATEIDPMSVTAFCYYKGLIIIAYITWFIIFIGLIKGLNIGLKILNFFVFIVLFEVLSLMVGYVFSILFSFI